MCFQWLTPRRFGMAEMLAGITGYSFLLALLRAAGADRPTIALCALYSACIGIAQLTFWRGRRPVLASVVVTIGLSVIPFLLAWAILVPLSAPFAGGGLGIADFVSDLVLCVLGGAVLGLGAGCVVAAVFRVGNAVGNIGCVPERGSALPDGSRPSPLERRPLGAGSAQSAPDRRCARPRWIFHGRIAALAWLVIGLAIFAAILSWTPIRARALHCFMDYTLRKSFHNTPPPPAYQFLVTGRISCSDATLYYRYYEWSRDELVRLGYLVRREYVLKYINSPSAEADALWRCLAQRFPENMYVQGSSPLAGPKPFRLSVWDTPDRIAAWDKFIALHDVPGER
jgi:hypothetical protein